MSQETFEDLCNPDTFHRIIDNLSYYETKGDIRAIEVFERLRKEAVRRCGVIIRSLDKKRYNGKPKQKKFTMIGLETYEITEDGSLSPERKPEPKPKSKISVIPESILALSDTDKRLLGIKRAFPPNYEEQQRKVIFPETCSPACTFITCPYRNSENYGKPCAMQFEQYENEKFKKEQVIKPQNVNEELLRNIPDYQSPLTSALSDPTFPKRKFSEYKESLRV